MPTAPLTPDFIDRLLIGLAGLGEMAAEITSNPDVKGSLRTVLRMIKGTFGVTRAALIHYTPETKRLTLAAAVGMESAPATTTLRLPERSMRWWIDHDRPVSRSEAERAAELRPFLGQNQDLLRGLPEVLWFPLVTKGNFYGLLMLSEGLGGREATDTEQELLGVIARQISSSLYNHALKFQLQLKVLELQRLQEISRLLHMSLNRETIVGALVENAVSLLDARRGLLVRFDPLTEAYELEASFGFPFPLTSERFGREQPWLDPLVTSEEVGRWDDPLGLPAALDSFSCLAVPVRVHDQAVGVLAVLDHEDGMGIGPFSDGHVELLTSLAAQAAASIENARLFELATVDGLTKLYIRRFFEQRFADETRRALRYGSPLSLLMIDIDHFKRFNDTYGHATGDEVLRLVAGVIRKTVREDVDIPARYGGEEMLVLSPETDAEGAMRLAERIRHAIETTELPGPEGQTLQVTVSVGVATLPDHAATDEALLEFADQALYRSKRAGRNRVTLFGSAPAPQEVP